MSKLEITVIVDTNDADYMTEVSSISEKDLDAIRPLLKAIKKGRDSGRSGCYHNYPCGDGEFIPRKDLGELSAEELYPEFPVEVHELFQSFCPSTEYGFHTVESVTVAPAASKETLV